MNSSVVAFVVASHILNWDRVTFNPAKFAYLPQVHGNIHRSPLKCLHCYDLSNTDQGNSKSSSKRTLNTETCISFHVHHNGRVSTPSSSISISLILISTELAPNWRAKTDKKTKQSRKTRREAHNRRSPQTRRNPASSSGIAWRDICLRYHQCKLRLGA